MPESVSMNNSQLGMDRQNLDCRGPFSGVAGRGGRAVFGNCLLEDGAVWERAMAVILGGFPGSDKAGFGRRSWWCGEREPGGICVPNPTLQAVWPCVSLAPL